MSEPVKLLLDECLGRPIIEDIGKLLSWDTPPPVVKHLLDYFAAGTCDSVWIPEVARENWIILTADRAKKSSRMKLPAICQHYGITHILMTGAVMKLKQNQKANEIISVWEDIKRCAAAPRGSRFLMQLNHQKKARIKPLPFP